ncbi:hypothetical protein HUK38_02335 [Thiospirillum jenense]|uniref:Uncharacterized protein n=1 Tax=Thiospirillum jenense TaxID=1653858 RepID=A0A839HCB4_9GAMM|nr:hypothetical protein [Thiospirillum jenense]
MKELLILFLVVMVVGLGVVFFNGRSHSINFHYNCNIDIPWYEAIFLDINKCPGAHQ